MIETLIWINVRGRVWEGVQTCMVYGLAAFRRVGSKILMPLLGCECVFHFS